MKRMIVSIVLLLVSASLSVKHGRDAFRVDNPEQTQMMAGLGISKSAAPFIGIFSICVGLMMLIPQTFFLANVLNAVTIVLIMAMALRSGNIKMALMEIPFLALPLLLIWLKYPFKLK